MVARSGAAAALVQWLGRSRVARARSRARRRPRPRARGHLVAPASPLPAPALPRLYRTRHTPLLPDAPLSRCPPRLSRAVRASLALPSLPLAPLSPPRRQGPRTRVRARLRRRGVRYRARVEPQRVAGRGAALAGALRHTAGRGGARQVRRGLRGAAHPPPPRTHHTAAISPTPLISATAPEAHAPPRYMPVSRPRSQSTADRRSLRTFATM